MHCITQFLNKYPGKIYLRNIEIEVKDSSSEFARSKHAPQTCDVQVDNIVCVRAIVTHPCDRFGSMGQRTVLADFMQIFLSHLKRLK